MPLIVKYKLQYFIETCTFDTIEAVAFWAAAAVHACAHSTPGAFQ
jgi:hypothetical protein